MKADCVKSLWDDFVETCCLGMHPRQVEQFRHVFYAAFEASLCCVVSAPHRFAGDGEAVTTYLHDMLKETEEYFDKAKGERDGKGSSDTRVE